jgi:hypothetical protein
MSSRATPLLVILSLAVAACACNDREDSQEQACPPCRKGDKVLVNCERTPAPGPAPEVVIVELPKQRRRPKPRAKPRPRPRRPALTRVGAGTLPLPED